MGMAENTWERGREQAGMTREGRRTMEKVLENTVRDTTAMHTFAALLRIGRRSLSMASSNMSSLSSCLLHLNWMSRTTPYMPRQPTCLLVSIHAMLTRETH